jgi:peptidoglycan/xylan/chitin deacetylase (PgdA/CDA1 family)
MYHSVGSPKPGWSWNHLVTPLQVFEAHLRVLQRHGWTTLSLRQLYDHVALGTDVPDRCAVLTFDDGYLDNYTLAWPLLMKYGQRAVIYASTDFIDPILAPRPTLADVWEGRRAREEVPTLGFISAAEMKLMIASGSIEIQSHAMTHTWYPSSARIVDFHRPRGREGYDPPPWLGWNEVPERKYAYLTEDLSAEVPWGTPIHEVRKSLEAPRCHPNPLLRERAVARVAAEGGARFFERPKWRDELLQVLAPLAEDAAPREPESRFLARVRAELEDSKSILERLTGQAVEFLCWPGGGRRPETLALAQELGYLASTTHFCDATRRNIHGQDPRETNRIGSGSPWVWRGRVYHHTPPELFRAQLDDFAGFPGSRLRLRSAKLRALFENALRPARPMGEY